jgi:nitrite reductase (NADH) large subunit
MGVDLAVMGEKQGRDADDEVVTYAEPGRGVYHKLIVREGKLAGAILLGDTSAAPALQQLFDRSTPLPDSRASLLFPAATHRRRCRPRPAGRRPDLQLQRRLEGGHRRRAALGCKTLKAVCDATRAGTGCGSCKVQVKAIVEAVAGDDLQDDPAAHYYVPGVAMAKRELSRPSRR